MDQGWPSLSGRKDVKMAQTLKKVEGKSPEKFEDKGEPVLPPTVGRTFEFLHGLDKNRKVYRTTTVRQVTEKKDRTIFKTDNSVYSLEKDNEK